MPQHDDLDTHFGRSLDDRFEIINFKPQQHAVSVWFVITIADGTMMVFQFEAMQL
jgi:hypothetical protein